MGSLSLGVVVISVAAQVAQATIVGTVRDEESGRPLVGAAVLLTDLDRVAFTDSAGGYAFTAVPAGPQHLSVRLIGYEQRTLHALVPSDGRVEINVSLRPRPISIPSIEVRPPVAVRGVEPGVPTLFPDRALSISAVRDHPQLPEPDALAALAGGEVVIEPEMPAGMHVRGGGSDQTAYLLDGIPVLSPYHTAGVFSAWNPDALSGLTLSSSSPSPTLPHALSGVVEARTRPHGLRARAQGAFSTTHLRLTTDGPIGSGGGGFLLSVRSSFPAWLAPEGEASYLGGETADRLAKVELPFGGGSLDLLVYDSENEMDVAAGAEASDEDPVEPGEEPERNDFKWRSRSFGLGWEGRIAAALLQVTAWNATSSAGAGWRPEGEAETLLDSERRDLGIAASVEWGDSAAPTLVGMRVERVRTRYRVEEQDGLTRLDARTPVTTAFAERGARLGPRADLDLGLSLSSAAGGVHLGPRGRLRWRGAEHLTLSASYARSHQFAQSVRNPESVVGRIFPADLFVGADAPEVPVARSDQGVIAAEYRPASGVRVGGQVYLRDLDGLLLVAPRDGRPFTAGGSVSGSGTAAGFSVDAAVSAARYGILASYAWQRVRLEYSDTTYTPAYGAQHLVDAGIILFPTATSSVRLGLTGAAGRRSTAIPGTFEWESCNLLDAGCEFGGSPDLTGSPLGGASLPAYLRLDLGARKHWHIEIGGRDAMVSLFGTVTNLFGRKNVLTYAIDGEDGEPVEVALRPFAPLVVGLEWRY